MEVVPVFQRIFKGLRILFTNLSVWDKLTWYANVPVSIQFIYLFLYIQYKWSSKGMKNLHGLNKLGHENKSVKWNVLPNNNNWNGK